MTPSGGTRQILSALRRTVLPHLHGLGFEGDYPSLTRLTGTELHFVEFQNDRLSGSFNIYLAWLRFSRAAMLRRQKQGDGAPALPRFVDTPDTQRARLHAMTELDGKMYSLGGYSYRDIANDAGACQKLAQTILDAWPDAEKWFATRVASGGVGVRFNHPPNVP